jgi:hypothetical protein
MLLNIINASLSFLILLLGYLCYQKHGKSSLFALLIAIAFGIFCITDVFSLIGLAKRFEDFIITARVIAYLFVGFALFRNYMKAAKNNSNS